MEYNFTLKYQLSDADCDHDQLVERLAAAGCDDALVGIGTPGRMALAFTRDAPSAEAAMLGALADVKRAAPSARLIEAAPDFVGLTDVAAVIGVTRQNMHKLMVSNATTFPAPVHEGSAAVWHLSDVLVWLDAKGAYQLEQTVVDVARTAMQVNLAKQALSLAPRIRREVRAFIG